MAQRQKKAEQLVPILLVGGEGLRLWPLSSADCPKPFLKLRGEPSLFQQAARRVKDFAPLIIGNQAHRFLIAEQLREVGVTPRAILLEPEPRNTAAAMAACVAYLAESVPDETALTFLPADHLIAPDDVFADTLIQAASQADDALLVMGITPTRPETGYGYIERGEQVGGELHHIARFTEKPDAHSAVQWQKTHLWNAGMFIGTLSTFRREIQTHAPLVWHTAEQAVQQATTDLDFVRLGEAFCKAPAQPFDVAVMEQTSHALVMQAPFSWDDLGSWEGVARTLPADAAGNLVVSTGPEVHALGIENLVVVATQDHVMVASREAASQIKSYAAGLHETTGTSRPGDGFSESMAPVFQPSPPPVLSLREGDENREGRTHRPWGFFRTLYHAPESQVKELHIHPRARMSLQRHEFRAEHWVVISGIARITSGNGVYEVAANQSFYVPKGVAHRIENGETEPLIIIEVQTGSYLGEDDIERLADDYGRALGICDE